MLFSSVSARTTQVQRQRLTGHGFAQENRKLIHTGKLLGYSETGFQWNGLTEIFALLFDNYCRFSVMLS